MERATSKPRVKKEAARSQPFPMKKKVQPEYMQPRIFRTKNPRGGRRIYASRRPPKASTKIYTQVVDHRRLAPRPTPKIKASARAPLSGILPSGALRIWTHKQTAGERQTIRSCAY